MKQSLLKFTPSTAKLPTANGKKSATAFQAITVGITPMKSASTQNTPSRLPQLLLTEVPFPMKNLSAGQKP